MYITEKYINDEEKKQVNDLIINLLLKLLFFKRKRRLKRFRDPTLTKNAEINVQCDLNEI